MAEGQANLTADVRIAETLDRLVITPRRPCDGHLLRALLRSAFPAVHVRPSAEGVWLPSHETEALLGSPPGLNLRWSAEAERFVENRRWATDNRPSVIERTRMILRGGRQTAGSLLADAQGLDVLDDHQWVNVAVMTLPNSYGACLFDEQGAGKTVTMIYTFDVLVARDQVDFMLIIAPKSMVAEWPRDFSRFKGDLYRVAVAAGARRDRAIAIGAGADVLVTNFETAVSMESELRGLLRRYDRRAILVVDESFYVKSLDAQRTRAIRRLREWCGRAFVLCGTPAPNAPQDLVQQFNLVDFGMTFGGTDIPEDRVAAKPVVQRVIEERGVYVRHLKADVLPDLPAKQFHRVFVPMQPEQQRLYRTVLDDWRTELLETNAKDFQRDLTSFLARRSALLQICSNPASVAEGYVETPAKLLALDNLLEEAICRRVEKVVLWSFYTASLDAICNRYGRFCPVRYDGTISDVDVRHEAIRRFQEDDSTMLFVGNPAAAGAGITLHRARLAVYESMSNQAAHYLQSLDRIHRRGQSRSVEYVILLCDHTLEVQEFDRLQDKERMAQDLLGDRIAPPITLDAMLAEANEAWRLLQGEP
jgi:SNF2 family DNA or RNA helicase